MSAPGFALLPREQPAIDTEIVRRETWWDRITARCARPDCPHRGKLWPTWLRKTSGVELDGNWYCEVGCLKPVLILRVQNLLSRFLYERPRNHRLPIGLLLVNRNVISYDQLREAMKLQRQAGRGRLGDWLRHLEIANENQITAALAQQWGCPVFPLEQLAAYLLSTQLLPLPLLESARAVPAYTSPDGQLLHLAFGDRIDHTALYAFEQMLGCRTVACASNESTIAAVLAQFRQHTEREETCFETVRDPREMSWTICSYATELRAVRIALVRTPTYIWVRFYRRNAKRDLLFHIASELKSAGAEQVSGRANVLSTSADIRKDGVSDASGPL
jgi:hypothetical protein